MKARLRPEPALSLAALRIVVPVLVLITPAFFAARRVAAWAPARWVVPEGLHWFVAVVPISPRWVTLAQLVAAFSSLCAIVGLRARLSLGALTLSTFYLQAIAQLTGWVWHDMHLLWFCALLAVSPCADVLAVDATEPLFFESTRYAVPLWSARLLLAAVYFFPGLHKLLTSGWTWALSDNLRNQLWWKWAEHGTLPAFRLDHHPGLLHAGGLFVMLFELSFPVLVLFRRTRPPLAVAGIFFHLVSRALFLIPFESLWFCYVVLVDLRPLLLWLPWIGRRSAEVDRSDTPPGSGWQPLAVGALLLTGAVVQGARGQMRAYPFACYPTFQWRAGTRIPDLVVTAVGPDGREVALPTGETARGRRSQRQWGQIWALVGVTSELSAHRLQAYYQALVRREPARRMVQGTLRVRFYRVYRSVAPDDRGRPPESRDLLLELVRRPASVTR